MSIVDDFPSIAAHMPGKEPQKYTIFITIGNRETISDIIGNCLMFGLGSYSQAAVDAFNSALEELDRPSCFDDYEFMCSVMKRARAKL